MNQPKNVEYRQKVFNMILFFASEKGMKPLPNSEEGLLLNMTAAVAEYLGSDSEKIPTPGYLFLDSNWTRRINQEIDRALLQNNKLINPSLAEALGNLLRTEWKTDHGESWWESGVRYQLMFRQRGFHETFCLTVPEIQATRENLERLDADTVEHCRQIGTLMRKYIARDLSEATNQL